MSGSLFSCPESDPVGAERRLGTAHTPVRPWTAPSGSPWFLGQDRGSDGESARAGKRARTTLGARPAELGGAQSPWGVANPAAQRLVSRKTSVQGARRPILDRRDSENAQNAVIPEEKSHLRVRRRIKFDQG